MIPLSLALVLTTLTLVAWGLAATLQALVWGSILAGLAAAGCLVVAVLQRRGQYAADDSEPLASPGQPAVPVPPGPGLGGSITVVDPADTAASQPGGGGETLAPGPGSAPLGAGTATGPDLAASLVPTAPGDDAGTGAGAGSGWLGSHIASKEPESLAGATAPEPTRADPVAAPAAPPVQPRLPEDPPDEPPIEQVAVADALRIAQLDADVLVIDGRPRYHRAGCPHLEGRQPMPLPVSTARRAGFTPCAVCQPDAALLPLVRGRR